MTADSVAEVTVVNGQAWALRDATLARLTRNTWQRHVIEAEIKRHDLRLSLRNVDREPWWPPVPYERTGESRPLCPDFLVIPNEQSGTLALDILHQHSLSRDGASAEAAGPARYAYTTLPSSPGPS